MRARADVHGRAVDVHQAIRFAERQRLQRDAVDDAEDRGDRADAERDDRDRRGARSPAPSSAAARRATDRGRTAAATRPIAPSRDASRIGSGLPIAIAADRRACSGVMPRVEVGLDLAIEMKLQLFVQLAIERRRSEQPRNAT